MRPVSSLEASEARRLRGLLFDLDDTVLDHGKLSIEAYSALFRMKAAGLTLIGVTGRPAAWGQVLARQWPVDGMVTENGVIALRKENNRIRIYDRASSAERQARSEQLRSLNAELQRRWPELLPSDEAFGRLADYAFDIAEATRVDPEVVAAASKYAVAQGARVVISSIQLHVAFDYDDKATGSLHFLKQAFGIDPTRARHEFAFIGDSENDAACFSAFHTTIGVRNLQGRPTLAPRFITEHERGRGFAEFAELLTRIKS